MVTSWTLLVTEASGLLLPMAGDASWRIPLGPHICSLLSPLGSVSPFLLILHPAVHPGPVSPDPP